MYVYTGDQPTSRSVPITSQTKKYKITQKNLNLLSYLCRGLLYGGLCFGYICFCRLCWGYLCWDRLCCSHFGCDSHCCGHPSWDCLGRHHFVVVKEVVKRHWLAAQLDGSIVKKWNTVECREMQWTITSTVHLGGLVIQL